MTQTVNSITIVDSTDGATLEYDGPFNFIRDGPEFEIAIPVGTDDRAAIHEQTAENLTEREGDFLIARVDGSVTASGEITAADIIENDLLFRVDDADYVDPADVEIAGDVPL